MGKISMGKGANKGPPNPLILPPMQTLKPLTEVVTIPDSPVQALKTPVKKYVSPLSLTWKRQAPVTTDTNKASSPPETVQSKKSPEKVANGSRAGATASGSSSLAQDALTESDKPKRSHKSSDPDNFESAPKCSRLSEGAFNISRICSTSTPIASKMASSDGTDGTKQSAGENKSEEDLNTKLMENTEADTIPRKKKTKKRKRKKNNTNLDEEPSANVLGNSLEDSLSSCIITAANVQEKEIISPGLKKKMSSPERIVNKIPFEIIDLDMTNEIINKEDEAIEILSIKKLPKKPVEVVDLSCTLDGLKSAPSANDTIIVIDDDPPVAPQTGRQSVRNANKARDSEKKNKCKNPTTESKLLKLQPHPSLMKKKERQRKKKTKSANMLAGMPGTLGQDEICFLGTGISFRPPKTNGNPGNGAAMIQPPTTLPSASAGSSRQNPQPAPTAPPSIYGSNFDNPNSNEPQRGLRPIVIDGSNVAMAHGKRDKVFSSKGIEICVNYFLKRGHKVYCFIPLFRKSDPFTKDRHILEALEDQGHLICTPSRYVGTNTIVPYDDRYIVQIAAELGGVIISRDNFRDLIAENPIFKEVIQLRTLMYTWVGDIIMFPSDPLGRYSVNLDRMLRF